MAATTSDSQCFCLPKQAANTANSQGSCSVSQNLSVSTEEILMTHACETLEFDLTPLVKVIEIIFQNAASADSKCTAYAALSDMICGLETFDGMRQALDDIRNISCEMSCNLSRSIDATTMVVLKQVKNYSWNAKVVLAIASIASSIGELSMLVNHRTSDLIAKSVDLIKGQPLKLDLTVLNNLLKAMMEVVNTSMAFLVPPISKISKGAPSMKDAVGYFPIATYKIIRIVVQIASILSKREENIDLTIRRLAIEVCNIHAVLQEKLERCRREIAEQSAQCQCYEAIQSQCHEVRCRSAEKSIPCQCHGVVQCHPPEQSIRCQCHERVRCQSTEQSIPSNCHEVVKCQPPQQKVQCQCHEAVRCQSTEAVQCQCHEVQCQSAEQSVPCKCHEVEKCQPLEQKVQCQYHDALWCQSTEATQCQCHEARCQSTEQSIRHQCPEVVQCQSIRQSVRCQSAEQSIQCKCHEVAQCQYEDFWELIPNISIWELFHKIKYNMKIQVPEKLKNKHVLFLISDLDISIEEIKVLNRLYIKNNQRYEIIWLPIVDVSIYDKTKFSCLKKLMKWGTVNPCKIGAVVIEYIKKEWHYVKAPIAVSLNGEVEVTCQNALPMLWTWGNLAFPFTDTREKDLWSNIHEAIGLRLDLLIDENIVPDILSWSGSFVCLFGGEDISWIRDFTEKVRMATNAAVVCSSKLVYVGRNKSKGLARNELSLGIYVLECEYRWQFWTRLESILYAKMRQGKSSKTDCIMLEALKVLGYAGNGETWAMFSMGSDAMVTTNGEMALTIMSKYRDWTMNTTYTGSCFFEALRNYYMMVQARNIHLHRCVDIHLPNLGQIPGNAICPECCKEMEMCYTYRCRV